MVGRRTNTVAEVDALVPELQALADRARAAHAVALAARARIAELGPHAEGSGGAAEPGSESRELADALAAAEDELGEVLRGFQRLGAEVKGLDPPLVDFLGERAGRLVWLCWKSGEKRLVAWHELDAGFAGRQPL
jgi:hypothetical protein